MGKYTIYTDENGIDHTHQKIATLLRLHVTAIDYRAKMIKARKMHPRDMWQPYRSTSREKQRSNGKGKQKRPKMPEPKIINGWLMI